MRVVATKLLSNGPSCSCKLLAAVLFVAPAYARAYNIDMSASYGAVNYGQTALGGTLRYDAPPLANEKLMIDAVVGLGQRALDFEDKSRWSYDWFGRRVSDRDRGTGETSNFASDLTQWDKRLYARAGLAYHFVPGQSARWVSALDMTQRSGEERLRARSDRLDPLTSKRQIMQLTSGLEYALRTWDNRIENSAFGKRASSRTPWASSTRWLHGRFASTSHSTSRTSRTHGWPT